ncbi:hypothetical protein [Brevundimonas vesicularis]|uniref:hypothetical protein n=1 Tax=Brevundimonas vesicularis TaxID=41276 RepID=UPI0022ABFA65|nr:hypothetical protein [Brevundimonas vesicularis]
MTAPSNANTSGLDYFGYRVFNAGVGACWLVANPGPNDTNPEPLVTAASAQARIDAAEARADRLAKALTEIAENSAAAGWSRDLALAALQQETQK